MSNQKTIRQATDQELKAAAFDIDQKLKTLKNQYEKIIEELRVRYSKPVEPKTKKDTDGPPA